MTTTETKGANAMDTNQSVLTKAERDRLNQLWNTLKLTARERAEMKRLEARLRVSPDRTVL